MIPTLADDVIPIIGVTMGGGVAMLAIIAGADRRMSNTRHREATKRELAAYLAEGSITADDAERILKSDQPRWERC
jgi:hypothetical protein